MGLRVQIIPVKKMQNYGQRIFPMIQPPTVSSVSLSQLNLLRGRFCLNLEPQASWTADTSIWTKKRVKTWKSWSGRRHFTNLNHVSALDLPICLPRKIFFFERENPLIEHSIHQSCFTKLNNKHGFLDQRRNIISNFSEEEAHQPGSISPLNVKICHWLRKMPILRRLTQDCTY